MRPNRIHLVYGDQRDKITQYKYFSDKGISALDYTTSHSQAVKWAEEGTTVICRTLTNASEGKGIVVAETPVQVVMAPVYTKYKKKKKEFRVHIFKDKVVQVLEKRRKKDYDGQADSKIRNTANGYVFCSGDVIIIPGLCELALEASKVTNSDFKGVDIGYNEKYNELFVIEVNSAPGIEGSNVDKYVNTIVNYGLK